MALRDDSLDTQVGGLGETLADFRGQLLREIIENFVHGIGPNTKSR